MMDLKQINEKFETYIRPQTFPVALKLCESGEEMPERVKLPMRDLGYKVTICQAIGMSRRYGWTLAVGNDHQCCIGGALAMGFISKPPKGFPFPSDKQNESGKYSYLLIAPITRAAFEPDIVVIYGNSAQAMRLSHSVVMGAGQGVVSARGTGIADCGDILTTGSDECRFILPSGGDRVYGSTQDNEVIFTIAGSSVEAIAKGLEETHNMGFRYPVLTDMRHRPALAPFLEIPENT
jgi:uncharacterized protein (DUF169 family)